MSDALLSVKNLSIVYKTNLETVHAVNGISFDLQEKRTLGLVGETGAGKTSVALALMHLLPERTGKAEADVISFNDKDILHIKEAEMRLIRGALMAMVFQDPMTALNPVHTVGKQIYEALMLHADDKENKAAIEKKVDEMLDLVGIPAARKVEYPHQFSGGMKQRVVIAMALACKPKLIIADEPTTALDVTIQTQVLAMMNELKNNLSTSMILITHDLGVVAETCDDVAIMYAGEIVECGTAADIFEGKHHHPYTTGLFGSIPDLDKETRRLAPIEGLMPDPTVLPSGCKFHPRCPHCTELCRTQPPQQYTFGTQKIQCHLFKEGGN